MDYYTYYVLMKKAYLGVKAGIKGTKLLKAVGPAALSFIASSVLSNI